MLDSCKGTDKWAYVQYPVSIWKEILKLINNSSRENKENHYRGRGLDMWS